MEPHVGKPWLQGWVARWLGNRYGKVPERGAAGEGTAFAEDDHLRGHAFVCGASNSGKSRLAVLLAREQLLAGCSVVVIDLKDQTIDHMLDTARRMDYPEERVTLLMPSRGSLPPWNPLDAAAQGMGAVEAVSEYIAVQEDLEGTDLGVSVREVMRSAFLLAVAHRLSFYEVGDILLNDRYRENLLAREPSPGLMSAETYRQVAAYFRRDYGRLSPTKRQDAADPVNRRLREILENDGARGILCSDLSPLPLGSLWDEPRLLLVHLDVRAFGKHGARTLGTLLARQLFSAALQSGGRGGNPVVLMLDEIGVCQQFLGDAPDESLAMARSYDLRLLAACQFLGQVEGKLRDALVSTTSFRAFFRLGGADAALAAPSLAQDEDAAPPRVEVEADERAEPVLWEAEVRDANGGAVFLYPEAYRALGALPCRIRARALENRLAFAGVPVPLMAAGQPLVSLLARVPDWSLTGPRPLGIAVSHPKPKARAHRGQAGGERGIARKLQQLPKRTCALYLGGEESAGLVEVEHVPDCPRPATRKRPADPEYAAFREYFEKVKARGQSPEQIASCLAERQAQIDALAADPTPANPLASTVPPAAAATPPITSAKPPRLAPAEADDSV